MKLTSRTESEFLVQQPKSLKGLKDTIISTEELNFEVSVLKFLFDGIFSVIN